MNISFSLSKVTPQITSERLKGYKWILAGQISIAIIFLFAYELFDRYPFPNWQPFLVGIIGIMMMAMNILSYELIKDLTDNKIVQKTVLLFLWTGVLLGIVTGMGIIESKSFLYKIFSASSVSLSFVSFIILLFYMINDIFKEKHDIIYRLWGSASIYMLIGSTFGLFFTLLEIIIPNEFMINTPFDIFHFIPCYNFSFYNLAGIDCPFENFSMLVRNIAVIESIFSNLYIVLVVGRLLSK
jgi:hypothetical protein